MCTQTDIKQADKHTNVDRISESPEGHLTTKQEKNCLNDMCTYRQTYKQADRHTDVTRVSESPEGHLARHPTKQTNKIFFV